MAEILAGSIDLNKIDKSRIKEVKPKDGSTAKFYEVSIFVKNEQDGYGNIASISEAQTKDERTAKKPTVYLGNLKRVWAEQKDQAPEIGGQSNMDAEDELPF